MTAYIYAQEAKPSETGVIPAYPKNEIGLVSETNFGNEEFGGPSMAQYKRWVKENMAYRINAGVGTYDNFSLDSYFGILGDTILEKQTWQRATMAFVGAGVEMHRHFYKHVYLYAAVDLLAGYGNGKTEDYIVRRVAVNGQEHTESNPIPGRGNVSVFHLNVAPFIGAKLVFNRISFGTEISAVSLSYTNKKESFGSNSFADMDMGSIRQRFFILFRF